MAGWDSFGSVVKFVDSDSEKSESEKSQSPVAVADPLSVKESSGSEADAGSDHEPSAPPAVADPLSVKESSGSEADAGSDHEPSAPPAVADPLSVKESSGSEADAGSKHEPSAPPACAVSQQGEDSGETTDVFDWQGDESEMPGPAAPASGSLEQRLGDVLGDDIAGDHSGSAAPGSGRQLKRNESTASSSRMQKR